MNEPAGALILNHELLANDVHNSSDNKPNRGVVYLADDDRDERVFSSDQLFNGFSRGAVLAFKTFVQVEERQDAVPVLDYILATGNFQARDSRRRL